ncbi:sterile alpha motif domain-containing protein 9-like [Sinocyclocheilus rhinocerous]|uniref:sterile alpha motif domain-containing protein 9-like n=1 Tax=Sinocyclocheilus rhinocerous TaxID=307959 RepID=UPI0007BA962D|nr:PREDICTED: sterile alpha motif domain-containing protein 9-like [Sinocyclocheilus rhinocerous]
MDTSRHSEKNEGKTALSSKRPVDISDWDKDHVRQWMLEIQMDERYADILYNQGMNGAGLLHLKEAYRLMRNLPLNALELIFQNIDLLKEMTQKSCSLKPYPFNRYDAAYRYTENSILDVTETGPTDLIQPCHEFKAFTNTKEEKDRMEKYTYEVIRFAAACMNSRTNGTIHFGVADDKHGQILGVSVQKTDKFDEQQKHAIERHFKEKKGQKEKREKNVQTAEREKNVHIAESEQNVQMAKRCIKPPRFVEVLKADMTFSGKYVIEVDIEPSAIVCQDFYFKTFDVVKNEQAQKDVVKNEQAKKDVVKNEQAQKKKDGESFFIRDGSSSSKLVEYEKYIANNLQLSKERKDAEEKHLSVVKIHAHASALSEMITGGTHSMDCSRFMSYIVVANKSHLVQLENLDFLRCMNLMAVLDFDPQSAENGLNKLLKERKKFNDHLPAQYKDTGAVADIASSLERTENTSWFFCNGGIYGETPSDADNWLTEKGSSVRDVVSFLCRQVLPRKKLLVIFLLFSQVSEASDPLFQTFSMFQQELMGQNQILCISDNETLYTYWNDLIKHRHKCDISKCIYELSFAEINGTILSLCSELRKLIRFLPSCGGSKVALFEKTEESLHMLSILCVNQCDGGHQDKQLHEENFHKEGKVSWWNFYYSEQPGSASVIKRDKLDYIVNTIIPNMLHQKRACVFFNIVHVQGCGGTTLAMHVQWTLKEKFRCAVLKDTTDDYTTAAKQVVQLLTYKAKEQPTRLPVLLMTDRFQDIRNVTSLQHQIEKECLDQHIFSKSPQVIIVNCMRVDSCEPTEGTGDAVFIPNYLSENELKLFDEKMEEFKTNRNTETFYVSMIADKFSPGYIQRVVKNTLKDFNFQHKHAQLFAVLVLLHVYSKNALLSVSTCEEFLGLQTKAESCNVEDAFEKFSSLLKRSTVFSKVTFEGMMVIHSRIAQHCLEELSASHGVTKEQIANLLLTTDLFYEKTPEKRKFMQDVQDMLMKRQYSAKHEDLFFSRLIQDIMKETPGMEETVLLNAAECLREEEAIFKLLARYYCIKKQDFTKAMVWVKKAKDHSREDSYISDTVSQVLLLVFEDNNDPIKPDSLDRFLTLAESVAEACKNTQQTPKEEAVTETQEQTDYNTYNTAGHFGELQTAATVIEILQKIQFKAGFTYSNWLTHVLLGKITIKDLSKENPGLELKQYCDDLQKHERFLLQLKDTLKQHFVFFNNLFVNLVPLSAGKDKQNDLTKCKVSSYFQQYTELFCELDKNKDVNRTVNVEQMRQFLESNKGDSYAGLLEYLYKEDSASTLEEIIQMYNFILKSKEARLMDTVNFIYTNVILAKVEPKSRYIMPYQDLCNLLNKTDGSILPLYYIKVLLLWSTNNNCDLQDLVSKMKESYSTELKPWSSGKKAAVHFYLGEKKGYDGLIFHREINSGSEQNISTQWDDENIWRKMNESKKLCRVSGKIANDLIRVKGVEVDPIFRRQLCKESDKSVTFFIGFSMNGPVALDIHESRWFKRLM